MNGPVPPAVVQNWFVNPSQAVAGVSGVAVLLELEVKVAHCCAGVPHAPSTVTQ
ncbi:hypothetical protein D3C83_209280 [compost metagenome]